MDECPHCGEPIEEDAERCPHCGSDAETGWNPDADYYSVELPEDEVESSPPAAPSIAELRWERILGLLAVILAATVFVWAAGQENASRWVPLLLILGLCLLAFWRWVGKASP